MFTDNILSFSWFLFVIVFITFFFFLFFWLCLGPCVILVPQPGIAPTVEAQSLNHWTTREVLQFSSVQFSRSVVSDSSRPHESQHARPPCPSPTPGVHSNSHPSSWWCHQAISSSVVPFSSCPQSLPASESSKESTLCMRWPSTGVSALASFQSFIMCFS